MQIIRDERSLQNYLLESVPELIPEDIKARYPNDKTGQINILLGKNPLLFDTYLTEAIEVDVDCLCDGKETLIVGIMEHIEEAGIHSGDSACSLPIHTLSQSIVAELERQTKALAQALHVRGLMNVQYAIKEDTIYVLEVNPRASRTVPFVAKPLVALLLKWLRALWQEKRCTMLSKLMVDYLLRRKNNILPSRKPCFLLPAFQVLIRCLVQKCAQPVKLWDLTMSLRLLLLKRNLSWCKTS